MIFHSAGVIAWTFVDELLQSTIEELKAGFASSLEIEVAGPNGVVAFVTFIARF